MTLLIRVVAPHFVAGLVLDDEVCREAPPILKWTICKDREFLRGYFARKGWKATVIR